MIKGSHHSEETRRRLSISHKGNRNAKGLRSEAFRLKNSEIHAGQIPWNKGKQTPENVRKKQSESKKGKPNNFAGKHFTEESLRKLSEAHKGQKAWNKGKGQFDWSNPQIRLMKHNEYVKTNRDRRRRIPNTEVYLNDWFPNSCLHHVGYGFAIYIPKSLHQSIHHSLIRNRNMDAINSAAINWLHADANASFNIGKPVSHCILGIGRSCKDRDLQEGSTGTPKAATPRMMVAVEPHML